MDKDQKYYAEVAHGCDILLEQHPLGTNEVVRIQSSDAAVPIIIRDLYPSQITISSNRVWVMVGVRAFGISWSARDGDSSLWELKVYPEGPESVTYVEKRR